MPHVNYPYYWKFPSINYAVFFLVISVTYISRETFSRCIKSGHYLCISKNIYVTFSAFQPAHPGSFSSTHAYPSPSNLLTELLQRTHMAMLPPKFVSTTSLRGSTWPVFPALSVPVIHITNYIGRLYHFFIISQLRKYLLFHFRLRLILNLRR